MLGPTLDYFLLRGLAHRRNLAIEPTLAAVGAKVPDVSDVPDAMLGEGIPKLRKLIDRFEGRLSLKPNLRYLDMGCGDGELSIALARLCNGSVTGVDLRPHNIERARALAARLGLGQQIQFICRDLHDWTPTTNERFDVLLSFDALEHIDNPRAFLAKMAEFMAPGGMAILAFGPLFHSPFGDHCEGFFRVQIPWRGVLFDESAVLRLRQRYFRPTDPAKRLRDVAGGLNQMRFADFLRDVPATGWEFDYLAVNTFLKSGSLLRRLSDRLMRVPRLRDYFAHNVYAVLRRK